MEQHKLETKMAKTQTKANKTSTSKAKTSAKKEVKPVKKKTIKTTTKKTTTRSEKTVVKKTAPKKKASVKTVTVTLDQPVVMERVDPVMSVPTIQELVQKEKPKTRNILELYFDNWIHMFSFSGRASRAEFITFWSIAILLFPVFVPYAIFTASLSYAVIIASALLIAALFTLSIRRAHDMGRSGFWGALIFITVFGILSTLANLPQFTIIYIFSIFGYFLLSFISGTKGANKYGDEPVKPSKIAIAFNTLFSFSLVFTGVKLVQLLVIFFQGY